MAKPSRPIIWTAVLAIAAGGIFYLTQPETTTTHHFTLANINSSSKTAQNTDGITAADLTTRFPRYHGGKRNPFIPGVSNGMQSNAFGDIGKAGSKGGWALTGVNIVNGITSAVIENGTSGDSVFLKRGDTWNGLQVMEIESDAVIFENGLAQTTRLGFAQPAEPTGSASASTSGVPVLPAVPTLSEITPLPAASSNRHRGGRRSSRGRQNNGTTPNQNDTNTRNDQPPTDSDPVPNESENDQ